MPLGHAAVASQTGLEPALSSSGGWCLLQLGHWDVPGLAAAYAAARIRVCVLTRSARSASVTGE